MSNASVAPRSFLAPLAPALERARLSVAPRRRTRAGRVPFVVLVSALLIGGVVGLLMFIISMQQESFAQDKLQQRADDLAARQQALTTKLQAMDDPQRIAELAQRQGMVLPGPPTLLTVPSGKTQGQATPADPANKVQLWAVNPAPRYKTKVVHTAR